MRLALEQVDQSSVSPTWPSVSADLEVRHVLQADEALAANEVPVGCVFVRDGSVIAAARNRTNEWRNVSPV